MLRDGFLNDLLRDRTGSGRWQRPDWDGLGNGHLERMDEAN